MKILQKKAEQFKLTEKKPGSFGKSRYEWNKIFSGGQQVMLEHGTEAEVEAKEKDFSGKVQNLAFNATLQGKKMGYHVLTLITEEGDLVLQARPGTEEEKEAWKKLLDSHKTTLAESKEAKKLGMKVRAYRTKLAEAEAQGITIEELIATESAAE